MVSAFMNSSPTTSVKPKVAVTVKVLAAPLLPVFEESRCGRIHLVAWITPRYPACAEDRAA